MSNNNAAHALVSNETLSEDFYGMSLSRWLTDNVEKYGSRYAGLWAETVNVAEHASLDGWGGVAVAQEYTRSGSLWKMSLTCPSVGVEDEPNHGRHTCEWISELAATRSIHDALMGLDDRSGTDNRTRTEGPGWLFADDTLWFDPTNARVRAAVERFEFEDSTVHEDYITELEAEYIRQVSWPSWLDMHENDMDSTVDRDRLYETFVDYETSPCTQCHVSTKPHHVADQIMRTCRQDHCHVWTDSRREVCEHHTQN